MAADLITEKTWDIKPDRYMASFTAKKTLQTTTGRYIVKYTLGDCSRSVLRVPWSIEREALINSRDAIIQWVRLLIWSIAFLTLNVEQAETMTKIQRMACMHSEYTMPYAVYL